MPYSGIWLMTKKMTKVTLVHIIRWLKGTLVSGTWTSGMRGVKGFTRSRKRTVERSKLARDQPLRVSKYA